MKRSTAVVTIPFVLVLLVIILWIGRLPPAPASVAGVETLVYCGYLLWRARARDDRPAPVANLLGLYPGHLLLLLAISLVSPSEAGAPVWAWMVLAPVTIAYDMVSLRPGIRGGTSILTGLYCILWADLFYLLERVIAQAKGFSGTEDIVAAVAFGVVGILFVSIGVYRHRRAAKG